MIKPATALVSTLVAPLVVGVISPEWNATLQEWNRIGQEYARNLQPYIILFLGAYFAFKAKEYRGLGEKLERTREAIENRLDESKQRGLAILKGQEEIKTEVHEQPANVLAGKVIAAEDLHTITKGLEKDASGITKVHTPEKNAGKQAENYPVSSDTDLGREKSGTNVVNVASNGGINP